MEQALTMIQLCFLELVFLYVIHIRDSFTLYLYTLGFPNHKAWHSQNCQMHRYFFLFKKNDYL